MSIFRTIGSWFAGVMHRRHARRRDQFLRVAQILIESGNENMGSRMHAAADIQDAYAMRWLTRT